MRQTTVSFSSTTSFLEKKYVLARKNCQKGVIAKDSVFLATRCDITRQRGVVMGGANGTNLLPSFSLLFCHRTLFFSYFSASQKSMTSVTTTMPEEATAP